VSRAVKAPSVVAASLPRAGAPLIEPAIVGLVLLGGGLVVVRLQRQRQRH
jgi:hypothetical protein